MNGILFFHLFHLFHEFIHLSDEHAGNEDGNESQKEGEDSDTNSVTNCKTDAVQQDTDETNYHICPEISKMVTDDTNPSNDLLYQADHSIKGTKDYYTNEIIPLILIVGIH